nr:hypothetical protein [Tanacetum cinerariifolium]GFA18528.1 hypothetical protein [Tanacetum cinerariifolium]
MSKVLVPRILTGEKIMRVCNGYGITITNRSKWINAHIKNITKTMNIIIKSPVLQVDLVDPSVPADPMFHPRDYPVEWSVAADPDEIRNGPVVPKKWTGPT